MSSIWKKQIRKKPSQALFSLCANFFFFFSLFLSGSNGFATRFLLLKFATEAEAQRLVREKDHQKVMRKLVDARLSLEVIY